MKWKGIHGNWAVSQNGLKIPVKHVQHIIWEPDMRYYEPVYQIPAPTRWLNSAAEIAKAGMCFFQIPKFNTFGQMSRAGLFNDTPYEVSDVRLDNEYGLHFRIGRALTRLRKTA